MMRVLGMLLMVMPLVVAAPVVSFAQAANTPAALPAIPGKASARQVADFEANPQGLLTGNPIGGLQLSGAVKSLALADPNTVVDDFLNQLKLANSAQVAAIGSGLGEAIKAIQAVDKTLGDDLAKKVALSGSTELLAAYNLGQSDIQTFAIGGGGGGGGGGGLGGPVGGIASSAGGGTHTSSAPGNFNTANSPTASTSTSFTGGTGVTCTKSVSPKRTC